MKTTTLSTRFHALVNRVVDSLTEEQAGSARNSGRQSAAMQSRPQRRDFYYYMQVQNADTKETLGHLADISSGGFKLDCRKAVPVNQAVRLLINLPNEIANKPYMVFQARSRWCEVDPLHPCAFNVGYQLTQIYPEDLEIMNRMMERYGRECKKRNVDLRRSHKW